MSRLRLAESLSTRLIHAWGPPAPEPSPAPLLPEALCKGLRHAGLGIPAYLFLELQRPLLFVYGQLLRVGGAVFPGAAGLAALLEEAERLQALLVHPISPVDLP